MRPEAVDVHVVSNVGLDEGCSFIPHPDVMIGELWDPFKLLNPLDFGITSVIVLTREEELRTMFKWWLEGLSADRRRNTDTKGKSPTHPKLKLRFHLHLYKIITEVSDVEARDILTKLLNCSGFHSSLHEILLEHKELLKLDVRSMEIGELVWDGEKFLHMDEKLGLVEVTAWIYRCIQEFKKSKPSSKRSREILVEEVAKCRRMWEKAVGILKKTLGPELAESLEKTGRIEFKTNGDLYRITREGAVWGYDKWQAKWIPLCIHVKEEESLPAPEVVLSKYLVLRDRPEDVWRSMMEHMMKERNRRKEVEARLVILQHEIARLRAMLHGLGVKGKHPAADFRKSKNDDLKMGFGRI